MIRIIYGKKGSGKSKLLVDMANKEVESASGNIVYIDDDSRVMYNLRHEIRFVDITHYGIENEDMLFGMVCGMLAQDYDIDCIFMDGIRRIIEEKLPNTQKFFKNLKRVLDGSDVKFTMIISGDEDNIPDFIKEFID